MALGATVRGCAWHVAVLVKLHKVGSVHVFRIEGDSSVAEARHKGVEIHVNDSVISVFSEASNLSIVTLLPSAIIVRPWACIAVSAMRVSDFDNLGLSSVLELNNTDHSESVALMKTIFVLSFVTASWGAAGDNVAVSISFAELLPDCVLVCFLEGVEIFPWGAIDLIDAHSSVTRLNMEIVAVSFGECLLQDGHPDGSIFSKLGEGRSVDLLTLFILFDGRNSVVDNDSVGDTETHEVDSVDARFVELSLHVEEDFLHARGCLSDSSS